jgi:hypothetical protein
MCIVLSLCILQVGSDAIIAKCRKKGILFEDPEFACTNAMLFPREESGEEVEWKRPSELNPAAQLFVGGVEGGDVVQGELGDCFFLGALSMVAVRPSLLEKCIAKAAPDVGVYVFRFYKYGKWHEVMIDDRLPTVHDKLIYARCKSDEEYWVPLIEKAYAKLHQGYFNLDGGSVQNAMVDLTGGASEKIIVGGEATDTKLERDNLWQKFLQADREEWLMGCAMTGEGATESDTGSGILLNHAYGVMRAVDFEGNRLLRVRNPWGKGEWTGAWSDGAAEWTPAREAALEQTQADDGTFFIEFSDFIEQYNKFYICRLYDDETGEKWLWNQCQGAWQGDMTGGSVRCPTWTNNPQFSIATDTPDTQVFISLTQPEVLLSEKEKNPQKTMARMGFVLLRVQGANVRKRDLRAEDIVYQSPYVPNREIAAEVTLEPEESYVIVPTCLEAGEEGHFVLTVYSEHTIALKDTLDIVDNVSQDSGEWNKATGSDTPNGPNWRNLKQFSLHLQAAPGISGKIPVSLQLKNKNAATATVLPAMGMYVFQDPPLSLVTDIGTAEVVGISLFRNAPEVFLDLELDPGHQYVVLPCCSERNQLASYTVSAIIPKNVGKVTLRQIKPAGICRAQLDGVWFGDEAGGSGKEETWRENPRFQFHLTKPTTFTLILIQKKTLFPIGFYVVRDQDGDLQENDLVGKTDFVASPSVSQTYVDVPASNVPYTIVPCTYEKDCEGEFTVQIISTSKTSFKKVSL